MSPATVRQNCVVCGIQWFNREYNRGPTVCVRKIKGNGGRLKEKKNERE